ncbi:MAG TPA: signal recognition particle-docking protein FtsY [Pseudonocardia sp.]
MNLATVWIVVAVVVLLLLVVLVVGLVTARRRRVSLREEQPEQPEQKPREGYRSTGQISFSAGTSTLEPPAKPAEPPAAPKPAEPAPPARPTEPSARPAQPTEPAAPTTPAVPTEAAESDTATPTTPAVPTKAVESDTASPTKPVDPTKPAPDTTAPDTTAPTADTAAPGTAAPAPTQPAPTQPAPTTAPAEPSAPSEPIAPPEGRLERLRGRLAGSRGTFGQSLLGLLGGGELDEDSWEEIEDTLLMADLGADTTTELVATLRAELARRGVRTAEQARQMVRDVLVEALSPSLDRSVHALPHGGRPAIVLVAGVNGTGKTTTTGKLARVLVGGGRTVVLGAADTFRAAAAEQLVTWGERAGATVVRGKEGADPASVAFEAVKQAADEGSDAVLLDTAGRLHTKTGLMDELGKIKRVVSRQGEVDEVLLVLDATTGQNGVIQARVFAEAIDITGIVLTKLDGTAKGGIVFRVQRELGVPVKLVGLGEGPDDLAPFEPGAFVDALLG